MNCTEIQNLLPLWEVGELPDAKWKFIDRHLMDCPKCQKALESLPEPELPKWLEALVPVLRNLD
jgi:hypothetical protein